MSRDLVVRAQNGDLDAFDALVARFQDAVCAMAFAMLGSFEDAQDIAQEVFVQAWRDLHDLRDPARFAAWLSAIARNRCRDHLRRPHRATGEQSSLLAASDRPDPFSEAARRETRGLILAEIRSLSEPNRIATTLFYIDDYSVSEVAEMLGVPVGTVKRRLHDSRKQLRKGMIGMVRGSLDAEKPGPELRARVAAELRMRQRDWDRRMGALSADEGDEEWAAWWHERRMEDVRANAAQYGLEPDGELRRMLPGYRQSETFRDDLKDMPRRWGFPEGVEPTNLRDLSRDLLVSPLSIRRWEQEGLPALRYYPWVLYDADRVSEWLAANRPEPVLAITPELARKPYLSVLQALSAGFTSPDEAAELYDRLETPRLIAGPDPLWAEEWAGRRERERRANAAQYGLDEPTDCWLGIPQERVPHQWEIRDLTRRMGVSPIDVVRWTRDGMPCLRSSPLVRWDVDRVGEWLVERGIIPARAAIADLDWTERFVCRAVASGEATPDEAHEALSGRHGVM